MLKLYFDGGCSPNPGNMEMAVISHDGSVAAHVDNLGWGTNNEAEWWGLINAVSIAIDANQPVTIYGDSLLVISQAKGEWKCKKDNLKKMLEKYKRVMDGAIYPITLEHVPRDRNLAGVFLEGVQKQRG